jgi:hypothetical protein
MISPYMKSFLVLVALGVLTGLEYAIGTADASDIPVFSNNLIPLAVMAVIKAGIIINYYMHISRIWGDEEDAH